MSLHNFKNLLFALWFMLLHQRLLTKEIGQGYIPIWQNDSGRSDCKHCLVSRSYYCKLNDGCESNWYKESVYLPFTENCFGIDQLNRQTINEFLRLLRSGNEKWREPFQKLLDVVDGLGLWSNQQYSSKSSCARALRPSRNKAILFKHAILENGKPSAYNQAFSTTCTFAPTTYICPANYSSIWKERVRLCHTDTSKLHSCECRNDPNVTALEIQEVCQRNNSCDTDTCDVCPCTNEAEHQTISTTNVFSTTNSTKRESEKTTTTNKNIHASRSATSHDKATIGITKQDVARHNESDWRIIGIILCIFVALLFGLLAFYTCWKMCCKSSTSTDDANSLHPPNTSIATNDVSVFTNHPDNVTDARYFCIGEKDESLYHTIDSSFRPIDNPNQSNAPPLPVRLFSLSSGTEEGPPHNWAPSPPSQSYQAPTEPSFSGNRTNVYGCIEPIEQQYEIPISFNQLSRGFIPDPFGHEYESEIDDCFAEDNDLRVNPLYSTSEDEI